MKIERSFEGNSDRYHFDFKECSSKKGYAQKEREGKEMKEEKIEELILGIDENQTEAWRNLQASWTGGALVMPKDENRRRKEYKRALKDLFVKEGVAEVSVNDPWLKGKIRRIMR